MLTIMNPWFTAMVIVAFASVIGFFQINSAWADRKKWNGKITTVSIALAVVAIILLVMVIKTSR